MTDWITNANGNIAGADHLYKAGQAYGQACIAAGQTEPDHDVLPDQTGPLMQEIAAHWMDGYMDNDWTVGD